MKHDLIAITKWPSLPAPFSSDTPGEAWVWGDFFATLQIRPKTVAYALQGASGAHPPSVSPVEYPFAMSVFYHKDKSPHGPSSRPVLVVALERVNYSIAASLLGTNLASLKATDSSDNVPLVKGLFTAGIHQNMGHFERPLTIDNARAWMFDVIRKHLQLQGEPVRIGVISDVHGHPNTGWPAQTKHRVGRSGCAGVLMGIGFMVLSICALIIIAR